MILFKRKKSFGFTLAEILIAIFIFAMIMSMLFSSFNSALSTTDSIREVTATAQMVKNCINRVVSDLQSIYLNLPPAYMPPDIDASPELYRLVGAIDSVNGIEYSKLRFTSSSHLSFGYAMQPEGIAEIVYYLDQTEEDILVMRRADHLYPYDDFEANKNDPVLCEKIKTLAFTYYDEEGADYEIWDSESPDFKYATPRAIRITLEIGDEEEFQIYHTKITLPVYRGKME